MEIELNLERIQERLTQVAKNTKKPWTSRSADGLLNSIKVSVLQKEEGETILISFKNYGLFLDAGVKGRFGGISQAGFFGTKEPAYSFKRQPKRELKRPPYPGYGYGITPRPWVKTMVDALTQEIVAFEEAELPKQIKDKLLQDIKKTLPGFSESIVTIEVK